MLFSDIDDDLSIPADPFQTKRQALADQVMMLSAKT